MSVRRRRCIFIIFALSAIILMVMLLTLPGSVALAHPADMYLQTHTLYLAPDGVQRVWSIYPGPLLVPSVWSEADRDGDNSIDPEEAWAWAAPRVLEWTAMLDDEAQFTWLIESVEWPESYTEFQIGEATILIHLRADWPVPLTNRHQLYLNNDFEEAISTNWFVLHSDGGMTFHTPAQQNGRLWVVLTLPEDRPPGHTAPVTLAETPRTYWDSGTPSLPAVEVAGEEAQIIQSAVPQSAQDTRPVAILTNLVLGPEISLALYPVILVVAIALGSIHALTPGHGKALVGAYLVGSRGTARHAVALGIIITLTHTSSVLLIGVLTLVASRFLVPTTLFPLLEAASGLLIVVMGIGILRNRWRGYRGVRRQTQPRKPAPTRARVIKVGKSIPVDGYLPNAGDMDAIAQGRVTWRALLTLGISGGMVPCPDGIAILLVAVAINRVLLGLVLIVAFSLGLAAVLTVIGIAVVRSRRLLDRFDTLSRLSSAMPLVSALVVLVIGIGLMVSALATLALPGASTEPEVPGTSLQPTASIFDIDRASALYISLNGAAGAQLFVTDISGAHLLPLTQEAVSIWEYALSPDKETVIYTPIPDETGSALWAIDADGTDHRLLLDCPESVCNGVAWSPDSRHVIYQRQGIASSGLPSLWWLDIATGETRPVFQDSQLPGTRPTWSPDGQWLGYIPPDSAGVQLYNLADGRTLSVPTRMGSWPAWSPDSDALVVADITKQGESSCTHLFRFDLETERMVDLTAAAGPSAAVNDGWVAWSPNGEWLAFARKEQAARGTQIWLMRPDGSEAHPVTDAPDTHFGVPGWSPDSRYLLVPRYPLNEPDAQLGIWLLDTQTGSLQEVVEDGTQPVWVP